MLIIRTSHLNHNMIAFYKPHIMSIQVITLSYLLQVFPGLISDKYFFEASYSMNSLTPDSASSTSALLSRFAEDHELNPSTGIPSCSQIFNSQRV